ncbi:MAG: ABC transporter substrate-binding protein [Burkholderiaceae bacterium]
MTGAPIDAHAVAGRIGQAIATLARRSIGRRAMRAALLALALLPVAIAGPMRDARSPVRPAAESPARSPAESRIEASLRERGRALFHGEHPFARPAAVAGAALPAGAAACAGCHGGGDAGSQGSREAGITVPWLSPVLRASPRQARLVVDALGRGESIDGRALAAPMPRYDLDEAERDALAAFLAVLGTDDEPVRGVSRTEVRVGAIVPADGPRAAVARAAVDGIDAQFDAVNRAGGVYGRRIRLVALPIRADPLASPGDWQAELADTLSREPVLALLGSWIGDLPAAQWQWLRGRRLPSIAALGPALAEAPASPGWTSSLLPSVQAQIAATANDFDRGCGGPPTSTSAPALTVALAPLPGLPDAVRAALPGRTLRFANGTGTGAGNDNDNGNGIGIGIGDSEAATRSRRLLALRPGTELDALRRGLAARDCLWTLAMFSGAGGRSAATELVVLPAPEALPMASGDPGALWPALGRLAGQLGAELLSRAGRRLQPETLVREQAEMKAFEPHPGVRLELSRARRHALPVLASWRKPDETR